MGASSSMDGLREEGAEPQGQRVSTSFPILRPQPPQSRDFSLLESMLQDRSATPICLPMDFLAAITSDFSEEREMGRGGFGVVYKVLRMCPYIHPFQFVFLPSVLCLNSL